MPEIAAYWENNADNSFTVRDSHLEEYPLFHIQPHDYEQFKLPAGPIAYRFEPTKMVDGCILTQLAEELIEELQQKKRKNKFKHFIVLQGKNYNKKKQCGLLVLKYKNYPFVLKLFQETPETFVHPHYKGFEPVFSFNMAGGSNRHTNGLLRIKNLVYINNILNNHPYWKTHAMTPRKWYWAPKNNKWIEIIGKNIGNNHELKTKFPGIFAIIADAVHDTKDCNISVQKKKELVMQLCNDVNLFIDPHFNNFMFTQNNQEPVIMIIDTEHFPSFVGLKHKIVFHNHTEWLIYLISKAFYDIYLRSKKTRFVAQRTPYELCLT